MDNKNELEFNKGTRFVKLYSDVIEALNSELTASEFVFVIRLSNFITNSDCVVRKGGHSNGMVLSAKVLSEKMEIDYSSVRRIIASLSKLEVIKYVKIPSNDKEKLLIKAIVCNPWIFSRGIKISKDILLLFENSKWKDLYASVSNDRLSYEYAKWKNDVLERDNYTCQCCGEIEELEVHHKENYMKNDDLRIDLNNGIALCRKCHNSKAKGSFHNTYGTRNNTKKQLQEYINTKRQELNLPPKTI